MKPQSTRAQRKDEHKERMVARRAEYHRTHPNCIADADAEAQTEYRRRWKRPR